MNLTLTGELFMMSDSLLFLYFFSRGVSGNIWFGLIDGPASFSSWDSVFRFVYFLWGKSCSGEIGCFLCSSYSWTDFPLFHDFDSKATRITPCVVIHFQNCHTDHFSNHLKVNSPITYSLLYISFPSLIGKKSWQSTAIDITQHARIDHKRQQKEKFKTKIN